MSSILIRRANMVAAGSSPTPGRLPAGYTELAYIEGTGTQYIDTGKVFNSNYKYKFKFKRNNTGSTRFAGYRTASSASSGQNCSFTVASSNNALYYATATASAALGLGAINTDEHEIFFSPSEGRLTYDGKVKWNNNFTTSEVISTRNFYLFVDNSPSMGTIMNGRFYYYQVYNGDTLVQDLVPAMRNSDNEVGFYDVVDNIFLTNAGSGTFSYGTL